MSVFNGNASDIEDNRNKVSTIDKNSTNKQYPSAKAVYDAMQSASVGYSFVANALKGYASGSEVVLPDVSPLEHELSVKLSGNFSSVSTETVNTSFSQKGDTLMLPSPVSSVTVNIPNPGAYIVGVIVPIIDGVSSSDLLANAAIPIQYAYGEVGPIMELQYSVSGSVVSWSGLKNWSGGDEASKIEISGSYDTGVSGIAISGFVQPYGLDEDNPYFQTPQYDSISFDISATVTVRTPVKVFRYGKNLFDVSSSRGFEAEYSGVTNTINGNEITTTSTANRTVYLLLGTLLKGTYTLSLNTSETKQLFIQYGESISTGLTRLDGSVFNSSHTFSISETRKLWLTTSVGVGETTIFTDIQLELGTTSTDYEHYITPTDYTPTADGTVNGVTSLYPNTTLMTDTDGVLIDCEYNRDINKAFAALEAAIATNNS